MKPGTKPKPTHVKLVTGNPGKRPLNEDEPEFVSGIPEPPDFLFDDARVVWDKLASELHQKGVLTEMDFAPLAGFCQAWARWDQAESALKTFAAGDPTVTEAIRGMRAAAGDAAEYRRLRDHRHKL